MTNVKNSIDKEKTADKSTYPKSGGSVFKPSRKLLGMCFCQSLCLVENEVLSNHNPRLASTRWSQLQDDH